MNRTVIKVIIGILAVGAAGAGGYFAWKKHKRNKEATVDNEPLETIHMPYKPEEKEPVVRDYDDPRHLANDIRKEKFAKQVAAYVQTEGEKENFEVYLSEMESPEDDDEEVDDEEGDEPDIPGHHLDEPHQISAGEFCNNRTYYDKISVNYFGQDDIVADDRDEILENANKILGNLQEAFAGPRAPSVIYIRNEALEADYEISYVDGSYQEEILHVKKED